MRWTNVCLIAGLTLAACGGGPSLGSNTHPHDLSAGGHRAEADAHHAEANQQHAQPVTGAVMRDPLGPGHHEEDAHDHELEASQHLANASSLERAEQAACAGVPAAERAQCPLGARRVSAVEDVPGGVRLRLAPGGDDAAATAARARCTHAHANSAGRDAMGTCIAAVRELTVNARDEGGAVVIELTTRHAPSVGELRRRAREQAARGATPPVAQR